MRLNKKKLLGAYYTSEAVTDCLSAWAIRSKEDVLLEPSFGGCSFLVSSLKCLSRLGNKLPYKNIYGSDIDIDAFEILREKNIPRENFLLKDFLTTTERDFPDKATVIIGNPPYLPIHKLPKEYRLNVLSSVRFDEINVHRRSSVWVYFIIHSLNFLRTGGRMAWIVPDSISFSGYGKSFLQQLSGVFRDIKLLRIRERFFSDSGTSEKTSILLCEGFRDGASECSIHHFDKLKDALLSVNSSVFPMAESESTGNASVYNESLKLVKLGEIFTIKIGIVLGDTSRLTFKKCDVEKSSFFPDYVYPIVTKGAQLENLFIDVTELSKIERGQTYLINGVDLEKRDPVLYQKFLSSFPQEVLTNQTFKKRKGIHPFGYDDFRHPDAFLTYFTQKHPRVIFNKGRRLNCTNSVHRLYLKDMYAKRDDIIKFVALQTFANYNADIVKAVAREYGNNILKYEPSDAANIPVLVPECPTKPFVDALELTFENVTSLIMKGKNNEALNAALQYLQTMLLCPDLQSA